MTRPFSPPPSLSPPPPPNRISRSPSPSLPQQQHQQQRGPGSRRTSVSIAEDEDPFATFSRYMAQAVGTIGESERTEGEGVKGNEETGRNEPEEEEGDWLRLSEEFGVSGNQAGKERVSKEVSTIETDENGGTGQPRSSIVGIKRSPSFLRSLWDKSRTKVRRSRSDSVTSNKTTSSFGTTLPTSTLPQEVKKKKISAPLVQSNPPRTGPIRSRASLISLGDVTQTYNSTAEGRREGGGKGENGRLSTSLRRSRDLDRIDATSVHPSGVQSLRAKPTTTSISTRTSILDRYRNDFATVDDPTRRSISRASSFGDLLPPTTSSKAFAVLGGGLKVTNDNRKAVERLTGFRSSVYETEQELGIALTTDAPTRYVVPDNRISLASYSTDPLASSTNTGGTDRSTLYSTASFSRPLQASESDRTNDTSPSSEYNDEDGSSPPPPPPPKIEAFSTNASRPLSPPPSIPLPALPVPSDDGKATKRRSFVRFREDFEEPTFNQDSSLKPLPIVPPERSTTPLSLPIQSIPKKRSGFFSRRRRTLSFDNFTTTAASRSTSSLLRFRSSEALRPVSSSTLQHNHNKQSHAQFSSSSPISSNQPRSPVASMYVVVGLNRDPSKWCFASDHSETGTAGGGGKIDHSLNAVPRFWRAEVVGCNVTGEMRDKYEEDEEKMGSEEQVELSRLTKEEIAKIQTQVVKLSFDRDVEIIASSTQPAATTSFFSFPIKSRPKHSHQDAEDSRPSMSGSVAAAWDNSLDLPSVRPGGKNDSTSTKPRLVETTYHAVTLTVWHHADSERTEKIRKILREGTEGKRDSAKRAKEAAKRAREMSERLRERIEKGEEVDQRDDVEEVDEETMEFDLDNPTTVVPPLAGLPSSTTFWLPYCLVLVSTSPLYSLLSDALRISWARNYQNLVQHSIQMQKILHAPLPRPGERLSIPVDVSKPDAQASFVTTVPGSLDWTTLTSLHHDFPTWPTFKALHSDNILSIAELALAPMGRVLFVSRHSIMLSIAVASFALILEKRGWQGLVHSVVHARDLRIFLEDPGPWLLAVPLASRSIAYHDLSSEVVVVDLDSNVVAGSISSSSALSTGSARDKARRRLDLAIGNVGPYFSVPLSIVEAFPNGRFRPFSEVEVDGETRDADRLEPDPSWRYDEQRVLSELDSILSENSRAGVSTFLLGSKKQRKVGDLDEASLRVQGLVRKHSASFVDRRDALEMKLSRLNQKLAILVEESSEWEESFGVFRDYSDKLSHESLALKARLENERYEARRLTSLVQEERSRQSQLEANLEETERAREQALADLANAEEIQQTLERQRTAVMEELQSLLGSGDESNPLFRSVLAAVESNLSQPRSSQSNRSGSSYSRYQDGSPLARRPATSLGFRSTIPEEDEDEEESTPDNDSQLEAMKLGVREAFVAISSRLSEALETARDLEATRRRIEQDQSESPLPPDSTVNLTTPFHSPTSLDTALTSPFPASPKPPSFLRPLTLTPPVSPELGTSAPSASPFVTFRHHRFPSRQHSSTHTRTDSIDQLSSDSNSNYSNGTIVQQDPSYSLSRSHSSSIGSSSASFTHRHTLSNVSQESGFSDYDDARSYVSTSEGGGFNQAYDPSRPSSPTQRSDSFDLEELAWTADQSLEQSKSRPLSRLSLSRNPLSPSSLINSARPSRHGRNDSCSIDAPPVELFTRSGSLRGRNGGGGAGSRTSIDLDARMKPSQVKASGMWEAAIVKRPTSVASSSVVGQGD